MPNATEAPIAPPPSKDTEKPKNTDDEKRKSEQTAQEQKARGLADVVKGWFSKAKPIDLTTGMQAIADPDKLTWKEKVSDFIDDAKYKVSEKVRETRNAILNPPPKNWTPDSNKDGYSPSETRELYKSFDDEAHLKLQADQGNLYAKGELERRAQAALPKTEPATVDGLKQTATEQSQDALNQTLPKNSEAAASQPTTSEPKQEAPAPEPPKPKEYKPTDNAEEQEWYNKLNSLSTDDLQKIQNGLGMQTFVATRLLESRGVPRELSQSIVLPEEDTVRNPDVDIASTVNTENPAPEAKKSDYETLPPKTSSSEVPPPEQANEKKKGFMDRVVGDPAFSKSFQSVVDAYKSGDAQAYDRNVTNLIGAEKYRAAAAGEVFDDADFDRALRNQVDFYMKSRPDLNPPPAPEPPPAVPEPEPEPEASPAEAEPVAPVEEIEEAEKAAVEAEAFEQTVKEAVQAKKSGDDETYKTALDKVIAAERAKFYAEHPLSALFTADLREEHLRLEMEAQIDRQANDDTPIPTPPPAPSTSSPYSVPLSSPAPTAPQPSTNPSSPVDNDAADADPWATSSKDTDLPPDPYGPEPGTDWSSPPEAKPDDKPDLDFPRSYDVDDGPPTFTADELAEMRRGWSEGATENSFSGLRNRYKDADIPATVKAANDEAAKLRAKGNLSSQEKQRLSALEMFSYALLTLLSLAAAAAIGSVTVALEGADQNS